jgi:hypothetical protein
MAYVEDCLLLERDAVSHGRQVDPVPQHYVRCENRHTAMISLNITKQPIK